MRQNLKFGIFKTKLKPKLITLLFIGSLSLAISCNGPYKESFEKAIQDIHEQDIIDKTIFVVMEQSGCTTCLYKADEFYSEYANQGYQDLKFIFTGYSSEKRLRLKYDLKKSQSNILLDSTSIFYKNNLRLEYPSILYFENNRLIEYEIGSPDNFKAYTELVDILASDF